MNDFSQMNYDEIGYYILQDAQEPIAWKDFLTKIITLHFGKDYIDSINSKNLAALLSEIHTAICMDSRFTYQPYNKRWMLSIWIDPKERPKRKKKVTAENEIDEYSDSDNENDDEIEDENENENEDISETENKTKKVSKKKIKVDEEDTFFSTDPNADEDDENIVLSTKG